MTFSTLTKLNSEFSEIEIDFRHNESFDFRNLIFDYSNFLY